MPYHVFCRRDYAKIGREPFLESEIQAGLKVLASILFYGLLLRPEKCPNSSARQSLARICFSEMSIPEMLNKEVPINGHEANHFDIFGPFAIGISTETSRNLGAMAVLSRASTFSPGATFSDVFLEAVEDIHTMVVTLAHIESLAHRDHDYFGQRGHALAMKDLGKQGVFVSYAEIQKRIESVIAKTTECRALEIEEVFEEIDPDRLPFWQLAQRLNWFLDFVQEADSTQQRRELAYYKQREWRIVQAFRPGLTFVPLGSAQLAQKKLKSLRDHAADFLRYWDNADFDECWLLSGLHGQPISKYITEVVCPEHASSDVARLLQSADASSISIRISR